MKKVIFALVCVFTLFATALRADDDRVIAVNKLPQAAQTLLKTHFAKAKVAIAKVESDFLDKTYDVTFADGNSIEFDKNGKWKEIKCQQGSVPASVIPSFIKSYVKENYPGATVKQLEYDKRDKDYDVKLSNGWELKFDRNGNLIDLDND